MLFGMKMEFKSKNKRIKMELNLEEEYFLISVPSRPQQ